MYPPNQHTTTDRELCISFIKEYPFATLLTAKDSRPYSSYLPIIMDESSGKLLLLGHLDKRNPQATHLEQGVTLIFHGPNTYISPEVYGNSSRLPTWNYALVEVRGQSKVLSEDEKLNSIIALSSFMVKPSEQPLQHDDTRIPHLLPHISAFAVEVEEMIGRFKLSQDKPKDERYNALEELIEQSKNTNYKLLEYLMEGR